MKAIYSILFLALLLTACEETVRLDLEQIDPKVVIEGLVTDKPHLQYVKVTRSNNFYTTGATPRITNAYVTVTDDLGMRVQFFHNPRNHNDSSGYYVPVTPFVGQAGRSYTLQVDLEGSTYEAHDRITPVLTIDSITYEIFSEVAEDPEIPGRHYGLMLYAKEPQATTDFYLFKFFRNDSLVMDSNTDIYFIDDRILEESINGLEAPVFYSANDKVKVQTFSISRDAYIYYNDLATVLNGDGGMFSPPPADSRNNLSNGALGFFQASSVLVTELVIVK
jgi:hypothetical protein